MKILYCNCTYAKVVPVEVKKDVLRQLSDSGQAFDAVADLCDMSARKDPALKKIAEGGCTRIAACFPRAVKWLFHAAGTPLPAEGVDVLNMREDSAEDIVKELLA
jgi:heterodisulfide reductase subunit A-like polyferredoxin